MGLENLRSKARDRKSEAITKRSPLADLREKRQRDSHLHPDRVEMQRILGLPIVRMMSDEEADAFSYDRINAEAYESGFRLLTTQASAVDEIEQANGGFLPIGVGWGKTGISIMTAEHFHRQLMDAGMPRPKGLLLIEPGCVSQFGKTDLRSWREKVPISVPFLTLGKKPKKSRQAIYRSGYKGCYVVPYSLLSVSDTMDMLEAIDPDYVIADEAHNLKDPKTARTKRFLAMMRERKRLFVAMSGTMTTKSIDDYRHLMAFALRDGAPLPLGGAMAGEWARVLDSDAEITGDHMTGPLLPLVEWAQEHDPDPKARYKMTVSDLRRAYTLRMHTAPGVVATGDNAIGASMELTNCDAKGNAYGDPTLQWAATRPGWSELQGLLADVQQAYVTPNGDEIECSLHVFKWMVELSTGFYNEKLWHTPAELAERSELTEKRAAYALAAAKDAHAHHQLLAREMRGFFEYSPPGLDTPKELGLRVSQGRTEDIPQIVVELWHEHKAKLAEIEAEYGFVPERYSRAVRVCDFKIQAAIEWAKKMKSGLIWVWHIEMGRWLNEEMAKQGLSPLYCPAGANDTIQGEFNPDYGGWTDSRRVGVASISAHCTGKNLQRAPHQLVLQWPRNSLKAEQMLGRVHRTGVEKLRDRVTIHTLNILPYDHLNMAACLNDSIYQHQTGQPRKMVYADYEPLPKIFSPEFLRENVGDTKRLNEAQRAMLVDKFGDDWETRL